MTTQTAGAPACLADFFSASVRTHPERCALYAAGRHWSYRELDTLCHSIEATLRATLTPSRPHIGVLYGRSAFTYAAILAVMRSGGVYVPLNGKLPAERLLKVIDDAQIDILIVDRCEPLESGPAEALAQLGSVRLITSEDYENSEGRPVSATSLHPLAPASLGYIIYTSGSTGVPKGVAITHASACACIEKAHRLFETTSADRFTQFSALSFDVSILDLFLCWKSGAALYVPAQSEALFPLKFVVTHRLSVWSSVPSLANFLLKLKLLRPDALSCVRAFLFCGEALPVELSDALHLAAPDSRIFNLYGPTESTIFATCFEYLRAPAVNNGIVPIGIPLPGVQCMIVDEGTVVTEDEVAGELWLSGDQLAVEYWRNAAATDAAFVYFDTPGVGLKRWYRTGDLVVHDASVGYLFRGRLDRQIKLRGFRIELQEVEAALREVTGSAVVAVIPLRNSGGLFEKIIAYCDTLGASEADVKARCQTRIPKYMVPDHIFELADFPLSESGKINYRALAARTIPARG